MYMYIYIYLDETQDATKAAPCSAIGCPLSTANGHIIYIYIYIYIHDASDKSRALFGYWLSIIDCQRLCII